MSDLLKRLAELSPEKRRLLELKLQIARAEAAGPALRPRGAGIDTVPLSFAQQRLWLIEELEPGTGSYNIPFPMRMRGPLHVAALARALNALRERHESLRTVFATGSGGQPVQVVQPYAPVPLETEDLAALPEAEREELAAARAREDAARGFDLRRGPLLRARLLRLGADEHLLLFNMHHIVSDGWSMGVVWRELGELYAAFSEGRANPLPPLPVQYADFALWQREHLTGETLERHLAFWRDRLAGAPPVLELPTDRPRPAVESHRGAVLPLGVPAALAERLRELARAEGTTLFVVLAAALKTVLGRHAGQDDVVIGTPIANRTRAQIEGLVGFFVNTLALRTDLGGDPSFRGVVRRVKETTLGAFQHQDLPFERLVEELRIERDLSRNPLVQVMFALQNAEMGDLDLAGLHVEPARMEQVGAKFDLTVTFYEQPDGALAGGAEYATDLFDAVTVERMGRHFRGLLERAVEAPDLPLSAIDVVSAAERRTLVDEWSGRATDYPRTASIPVLFAQVAAASPDAVAVAAHDATLTYAALDARANRLARHLRSVGAAPGSRVGLSLPRSSDVAVALLAILKAGAAYVPLDASYPAARLVAMTEDAGVGVLLVADAVPEALASFSGVVVSLSADRARIDSQSSDAMDDVPVGPESPAYVVFTSGSTGRPKGVAVPHRAVVRLVRDTDYADFGPEQVFLQLAPVAFDASTLELWGPLLNGGRMAVYPPETPSLEALGRFIRGQGVTTAWLTAGLFHQMVDAQLDALRGVRQLLAGGDVLSVPHVRRAMEGLPDTRIINGYGPTENTTFTCCHTVRAEDVERASVPIGRPVANTRVYVLDAAMQPLPAGAPGELYAGGDGVALGYLGQPALTAERFVADPFTPGGTLYRTGDRVRWLPDGTLEFLGRVDQQVKIRGFRIETGEIEAALCGHEAVREAAVVVREDAPGEKRLAAYVVLHEAGAATPARLRVRVQQALPEYMVPSAIAVLDALPLTPNGKVDRRALPAPDAAAGEEFAAALTPVEEVMAGIWAEVLRRDRVGATASFFELGGHSLLATQVVSRVRAVFGVELLLRAVFEASTVRDLSARVEAARAGGETPPPPVVPAARGETMPLSFAQERLWFIDQLEPGGSAYNMPLPLELEGALDTAALEWALGETTRRHEALRAVFAEVGGQPVQTIAPHVPFHLPVVALDGLPAAMREAEAERLTLDDALAPFDLARGPLFRARLLRLEADRHVLLLNMHHIVSDGWSLGILFREVSALYDARVRGEGSPLAPLAVQYADFAVWQRRHLEGERLERQVRWWGERLAGAPALLELPTDRPRPASQSFRGAGHAFTVSAGTMNALRELSRREGATLFMTLLAAWQTLLARYARQTDVVVGTPIAGRTRAETEGLVGFFVNTLPLRADLSADPTFRALLAQVREATLGAYAHQDLPFERLVEELGTERSLAYTPLFQVVFGMVNLEMGGLELDGVTMRPRPLERGSAKFDLLLDTQERADGSLAAAFEYAADLWDPATMERMGRHWTRLLEAVAADPDRPVSRLEILPADEERQVVRGWNDETRRPGLRRDVLMHEWFERQVARTPDAVALVHEDETLSYAELNRRANRLARALRARGVGPETRVGILMERTPDLVVSMYAVLKAGGAYVPLDPAYPAERVAFMLEDTAVPVLLTQERLLPRLPTLEAETIPVDRDARLWSAEDDGDLPRIAVPENIGYLIYTSGSTGRPKGIQLEHRSAAVVIQWMRDEFSDELRRAVLASTSVCFDVSIAEIFGTLSWGGTLVLVKNALSLANLPAGHEVVMASMVPSAAQELLRLNGLPRTLRSINLGGEPVKPALAEALHATGHIEQVVNLYGPSEDTTYTTALWIPRGATRMTVGRPVANTQVHILDPHGRPCPAGVPGELFIGGEGVTRGYHARPATTAEKYLPDPFSPEPGARMYRTGDLARYLADGEIEYLGRLDHQVKIRGHRVEIGEIEAVLATHPGLEESAVMVREDAPGMARLVAYYQAGHPAPTVSALRQHVRDRLPEYMVPGAWVRMDALPHTPNGKVDRRALPAPEAPEAEAAFVAPRTPTEQVLAAIWADVLGGERVGLRDNFFELGGHSLLATRVMSRVREALQASLPLRVLFEAPTVEALAERVDAARREARGIAETPLVPVLRDGDLPLSFAQERLWFLEQVRPGGAVYNMPFTLRMHGALDADALDATLCELLRRHESLRTVFARGANGPVQRVLPVPATVLDRVDLSALAADERHREARRRETEEAARPFDLAAGPLLRAALLRIAPEDHTLLLTIHHVASDGWSMDVLFREMATLYRAFSAGEGSPLPEPTLQYGDFAAWQREWLRGDTLERQLGYWRERLAGAATLDLPTDHPRPATQSFRGAHHRFAISAGTADGLRALSRREGTTLFMTTLAAFSTLIRRYAGQEDVVVGSPIAGRTRAELEELVGFFVNTLALRADLSGDPAFTELLGRVRETTLDAYAHQDIPFERLVEELKVERSLAHHPVFQVSFSLQSGVASAPPSMGGGLAMILAEGDTGTAKFDLLLGLTEMDGEILGVFEYAADLFEPATIERLAEHFRVLCEGIVADPARRLSELPQPVDDRARHRMLVEWNRTSSPVADAPVHALFEAVAAERPDAVALAVAGAGAGETVTYAALNRRANRIARHLRRRGVGPETRVGINLPRTAESVAAVLGVLKAGGAYVPLDPAYPADRLGHMVEDAGVALLVTERARAGTLPPADVHDVVLDDPAVAEAVAAESGDDPGFEVDADNLAYVIYTSGSTGRPKGVLVSHRGLPSLAQAQRRAFDLRADDRVLHFASLSFDAAVSELFVTLLAGATLVLAPRERLLPGAGLDEVLRDEGVSAVTLPPAALAALPEDAFPALRVVVSAGEACSAETFGRWARGRRFVNGYGPTETTVAAAMSVCAPDGRRPPIGRPTENTRVYVLDAEMKPVPAGVPGELFVGGLGLARGYQRDGARTAERFVPDPFGGEGGRLFRTGDRVRWRHDGELEFVARVDEQVKIRGFRIEPGEVEALLVAHPQVGDALVMAREDRPGEVRLVAYLTPRNGTAPSSSALRDRLKEAVPDYMVPAAFLTLDAFPLSPNGKVDRKNLPAPAAEGDGQTAPQSELERMIAGAWQEVLHLKQVGVHDNFFDIGGHSLLLAQLHEKLREALGREVSLVDLFQFPTVHLLAQHLDPAGGAAEAAEAQAQQDKDRGASRRAMLGRRSRR